MNLRSKNQRKTRENSHFKLNLGLKEQFTDYQERYITQISRETCITKLIAKIETKNHQVRFWPAYRTTSVGCRNYEKVWKTSKVEKFSTVWQSQSQKKRLQWVNPQNRLQNNLNHEKLSFARSLFVYFLYFSIISLNTLYSLYSIQLRDYIQYE